MTIVPTVVRYLLLKFRLLSLMPSKDIQTNQSGLLGALLNVWGGGFLVSLLVAGGCLELVHWSDEHVANRLSFV